MKYFELFDDVTISGRWHVGEITLEDGTKPPLWDGIRFTRTGSLRATITHPGRILDFCLTSFAVPIASNRLAFEIGAVAGSDLQSVPLGLSVACGMNVLNATRVVQCLDETRSEFLKWTTKDHRADLAGQYRQVTKLIVDPTQIPPDAHFFRLEGWSVALVVSEAVKAAMISAGCLGAKFIDINPDA